MPSSVDVVRRTDNFEPKDTDVGLFVGSIQVGLMRSGFANKLKEFNEVFDISKNGSKQRISFKPSLDSFEKRSAAVADVLKTLREDSELTALKGWRNEFYTISDKYGSEPLFRLERASAGYFGVKCYGSHLNAYTTNSDGTILHYWVARRSAHKPTWPNRLDNLAAGGLSEGLSPEECMRKESEEEASIPSHLTERIKPVGAICYFADYGAGEASCETEFCFDLQVPLDFTPHNQDGEASAFYRYSIAGLKESIISGEWKPNCAVVALDFLIRHGFIGPQQEPNYLEIVCRSHRNLDNWPSL